MGLTVEILEGNLRKVIATFLAPGVDSTDDPATWVPTDPGTVKMFLKRLRAPADTIITYDFADAQIDKISTGVYSRVFDFETPAAFLVGVQGTTPCVAYDRVTVIVGEAEERPT
jgi:hypothetical protein